MAAVDVLGRVDELASSVDAVTGAAIGPYRKSRVKRLVAKKSAKLKRHKEAGREIWLVVYNTFWTAMSPLDVREIVMAALGPQHDHIDHVGVGAGDPPDDAWLDTIR